ncbi:MAG TPA: hypothetical protein VN043_01165 [Rhodanobacter sp.]|nr:hypothetical protein [Rhodanobacter sp.]
MAMPLSWKIGAGVVGAIVLITAWNLYAEYQSRRHADELVREAAVAAERDAQQARLQASEYHAKLAESLRQHREDLYNNYQQINDQARQYRAAEAARKEALRQKALRVEATFMLDASQKCVGGIVVEQHGSAYSQITGSNGHAVACKGDKASEPLR